MGRVVIIFKSANDLKEKMDNEVMTLGEAIKKYPGYYIDEERYRTERSIFGRVMYFGEVIDDNK